MAVFMLVDPKERESWEKQIKWVEERINSKKRPLSKVTRDWLKAQIEEWKTILKEYGGKP